eukprot:600003-Amphidinium_carterae.2
MLVCSVTCCFPLPRERRSIVRNCNIKVAAGTTRCALPQVYEAVTVIAAAATTPRATLTMTSFVGRSLPRARSSGYYNAALLTTSVDVDSCAIL